MPAPESVRVLVVDDQEVYRETARFVLEMTDGFELAGMAETGEEGLDRAEELHPDLVLMDVNMPGIDGIDATRILVDRHPDIRVIVVSTYSADELEPMACGAGAIGFVSKAELSPDALLGLWHERR